MAAGQPREVRSTKYEVRSTEGAKTEIQGPEAPADDAIWDAMVLVGRIIRPHGHRGQMVVLSETDFGAERFAVGATLQMQRNGRIETVTVSASRSHDGRWVIGLEGVASMNDAEALRGCELRVPGDTLHELDAGRFYVHDLAGCTVRLTAGDVIGRVERVDFNAGIPLLVVAGETPETSGTAGDSRDPHADEILVPFTDAICRRIDVQARVIEIDPPEGLVELNRRKRK